jgi:hypothetical protein
MLAFSNASEMAGIPKSPQDSNLVLVQGLQLSTPQGSGGKIAWYMAQSLQDHL